MVDTDAAHENGWSLTQHGGHLLVESRAIHTEVLCKSFYGVVGSGKVFFHKTGGTGNEFVVNGNG